MPVTQLHDSEAVQFMLPQPEFVTVNVVLPELKSKLRFVGSTASVGVVLSAWVSVTVSGVPVAPGAETSISQKREEQSLLAL